MVPHTSVLSDTAFTLGKLPGPWENGEPKPPYEMDPIQVQLERIGVEDMPPTGDDRRRLAEAELQRGQSSSIHRCRCRVNW